MLWSLWIIYILFAENFKAKINKCFPFQNIYFLNGLTFVKTVPIHNRLHKFLERAHTSTLALAPFCTYTPLHFEAFNMPCFSYTAGCLAFTLCLTHEKQQERDPG